MRSLTIILATNSHRLTVNREHNYPRWHWLEIIAWLKARRTWFGERIVTVCLETSDE